MSSGKPKKKKRPSVVVFDLGGVLIGWDPARAFLPAFSGDKEATRSFLNDVDFESWNMEQDRGRSWIEAERNFRENHPQYAHIIGQYHDNFDISITGAIAGTVSILERLHAANIPLYAITNWAADTFETTRKNYPFMDLFRDIVVSGEEHQVKPDPEIYQVLLQRNDLKAEDCVFIDDNQHNVDGARRVGMHAIHFTSPEAIESALESLLHIQLSAGNSVG